HGRSRRVRSSITYNTTQKMPDSKDDPKSSEWRPYVFAHDQWHSAFAVRASCTQRRYANTLPMSTTRICRRACTSTFTAQFGSERSFHDLALNATWTSVSERTPGNKW